MIELTRKVATAWRGFFGSEEGVIGLQWILEHRPPLDDKNWSQAAGFEAFKKRVDEILEFERARSAKDEDEERNNLKS